MAIYLAFFGLSLLLVSVNGFKISRLQYSRFGASSSTSSMTRRRVVSETTEAAAASEKPAYSFVQDDLRAYAMKLHTRDQAPREGQQPAEKPFTKWEVQRSHYLQFLVDSLAVYQTLDEIVAAYPALAALRNTGLERVEALKQDIAFLGTYDPSLAPAPACGPHGLAYREFLLRTAKESLPKFVCHYYNQYFAHTAGGRMIGKRLSDALLEGKVLAFYEWPAGDVKLLLDNVRKNIDGLAEAWTEEEKRACMEETMSCFRYGGGLMSYMKEPPAPAPANK